MMVAAVIPARYGSTRLHAKALAEIHGKPMIQWVVENAQKSKLCQGVWVATDDDRIAQAVRGFGGKVVMTSDQLQSGTDRVAAVATQKDFEAVDVWVNVQGDEPLISGDAIDAAIRPVLDQKFEMASIRIDLKDRHDLENKNVVKVLVDDHDRALYFSRYPIPYSRVSPTDATAPFLCSQHVGIYVYRRETLLRVSRLPQTDLEKAESLEQLRAMKAGISIGVVHSNTASVGVDTAEDLEKVRRLLGGR